MSNEMSSTRRGLIKTGGTLGLAALAGCSTTSDSTSTETETTEDDLSETVDDSLEPSDERGKTKTDEENNEKGFETLEDASDWANQRMRDFGYRPMAGEDRVVSINNYGDEENESTVYFQTHVSDLMKNSGINHQAPDMHTISAAGGEAIERFIDDIKSEAARQFDIYDEAFGGFESVEDQRDDSGEPEEGDYAGARIEIGGRSSSWVLRFDGAQVDDLHGFADIEDPQGAEKVTDVESRVGESLLDDHKHANGFFGGSYFSDKYEGKVYASEGELGEIKLEDGRDVKFSYRENDTGVEAVVDGKVYHLGKTEDVEQLEEDYGLEHEEINPVAPYDEGAIFEGVHEDQMFEVYNQ